MSPALPPGKDKLVKYWDADKFEHLLTLEGHHAEVRERAFACRRELTCR